MKILSFASYYKPESVASPYLGETLREAIADEGIYLHLYVPTPSRGISDEDRKKYKKILREELHNGKLVIHRVPLFAEGRNPILRAIRYTLQCLKYLGIGIFGKEAKSCDMIMVSSTPPILGAMAGCIKTFTKKTLLFDLQDIFPDSLVGTGMTQKGSILWKIGRVIENFTYKHADKIIVISEDFKKNIMAKGVPEDKIVVVYNWVDQNAVVDVPREQNRLFDKYKLDRSKFYITYSGNIGLTQNMDMLLDVAKDFCKTADIQFVLIGEGAYKAQVEKRIQEENINNVTLLPFQPYEDISHVFSFGDMGLVISKPGVGANSVPSKTWSIMSASRPVLANFDENELKEIINNNKCGVFTKAGDKDAFIDAILKAYNDRNACIEMGKNGRQFVMENLTREIGTSKYVDVIKSVVGAGIS